jgi:putative transposase
MPRPPRRVEPGAFHHVSPRGNDGRAIFEDAVDRRRHLALLDATARRYGWIIFGYCQMTNHFHVALQDRWGTLSHGMCELQGEYSRFWNWRHGHTGHLFRNRFESTPILSDRHLISTVRYIDLNPVRARMKNRPEEWAWSSCRAHLGLEYPATFLALSAFQKLLAPTPERAFRVYERFVRDRRVPVSGTGTEV